MSNNSGIADGAWPLNSGFPSTVDFVLRRRLRRGPAVGGVFRESAKSVYEDVGCGATWMPGRRGRQVVTTGNMPDQWVLCGEGNGTVERGTGNWSERIEFRFLGLVEGEKAGPMGFRLEVGSVG